MSVTDAAVLAETERWSARFAAGTHVIVVAVVAAVASAAARAPGFDDPLIEVLLLADLAASLWAVVSVRRRRLEAWLAWAVGLLDVGLLIAILVGTVWTRESSPGLCMPASTGLWAVFLSMSLSAMRGRPLLVLAQTLLFAMTLTALATSLEVSGPTTLATSFGLTRSTVRIAAVVLSGSMLIVMTLRTRLNLRYAIVASRRAANLARYLAPSVASLVADADLTSLRNGREQEVAVLFADIRDFSVLADGVPPRELAGFLNRFRRLAAAAVEREGGVIDKFVGDEVMALFGVAPATAADAGGAIRAAQALLASVRRWSAERVSAGLPPVKVGVGIHHGSVFTGVLGDDRLEFTVLGSTVNVARRLEELTKSLSYDCLISAVAVRAARADASGGWSCRSLPAQAIRGHAEPVVVFGLIEGRDAAAAQGSRRKPRS